MPGTRWFGSSGGEVEALGASCRARKLGFTPISRTHLKRPIMGREVCHGETTKVLSGVQREMGETDRKIGGLPSVGWHDLVAAAL